MQLESSTLPLSSLWETGPPPKQNLGTQLRPPLPQTPALLSVQVKGTLISITGRSIDNYMGLFYLLHASKYLRTEKH
jgi:hypothetical protein